MVGTPDFRGTFDVNRDKVIMSLMLHFMVQDWKVKLWTILKVVLCSASG